MKQLVEIPSPTGAEGTIAEFLEHLLAGEGWKVQRQRVDDERFNLMASLADNPSVLFCTHLDTVLPHIPFSYSKGIIRGRGACDAKGSLASMVVAARALRAKGLRGLGFLLVVGEERHSDGAKAAAAAGKGAEYIILGEPTRNQIAVGQKGTLVFRVRAEGVAGHSAYPGLGPSAVHLLVAFLAKCLEVEWGKDETLGATTLNIGTFRGGLGPNVIAPEAIAEGIFRIGTSLEKVRRQLQGILPEGLAFEELSSAEPLILETIPGFSETIVAFGSDAPYLQPLGRVVLCGPGSIQYAHREDEQIMLEELEESVGVYVGLVRTLVEESGR